MPQHASSGLTILAMTAVSWSGGWSHTHTSQFEDVIVSIKTLLCGFTGPAWITYGGLGLHDQQTVISANVDCRGCSNRRSSNLRPGVAL